MSSLRLTCYCWVWDLMDTPVPSSQSTLFWRWGPYLSEFARHTGIFFCLYVCYILMKTDECRKILALWFSTIHISGLRGFNQLNREGYSFFWNACFRVHLKAPASYILYHYDPKNVIPHFHVGQCYCNLGMSINLSLVIKLQGSGHSANVFLNITSQL